MRLIRTLFWLLLTGIIIYVAYHWWSGPPKGLKYVDRLKENYEKEIEQICEELNLPSEYFKALVIIESSAEKPAGSRFEEHIYNKMMAVKKGEIDRYGSFTHPQLSGLSKETIAGLSTSWGPLQIMGYHSIPLGISLDQLRGEDALRYGILWCEKSYGRYLRKKDFQNAFHIHNTGRPLPASGANLTHDPNYIPKGMKYIQAFLNNKQ